MKEVIINAIRFVVGLLLFTVALVFRSSLGQISTYLFIASYLIVGLDVVMGAVKNAARGKMFDENFLMSIATLGAFFLRDYPEAVAVMLFFQLGELFQSYAVNKSRTTITSLMDIRPDYANLKKGDEIKRVDPFDVAIGDFIVVKPGEKIPLDGLVVEGYSMLDTSALTGESVPRSVGEGAEVLSGCINQSGLLTIEVTKKFEESTVSKILDIVENASSRKSKSEKFITRISVIYTPVVVFAAVLLAIIPPFILGNGSFDVWLYRDITFLVVSCPCALVLSIPMSFFGGIGGASRQNILVKGADYLESLAKTEIIIFDKTGTLTKGVFEVQEIHPIGISREELLEYTALAESHSNHPIAASLRKAYGKEIENNRVSDVEEIPGHGIRTRVDGKEILVGNARLMKTIDSDFQPLNLVGTIVYTAVDGTYTGSFLISDEIRADAFEAIQSLKASGVKRTVMLTGDAKSIGEKVAADLNIDSVYTQLLPTDKVEKEEQLLKELSGDGKLAFVGDGINDAPSLALADIGIAMGGIGSDAAIEAADVVIMKDELSKVSTAIKVSRKTLGIAWQNIVFSLLVKFLVLILSAFGIVSMWLAIFADVGVSVLVILNALRTLKTLSIR